MKANFGSIVVAGRGAIGEKVASRNAYGDFFRARVIPIDNPNAFKTTVRTYFKECSQAWRNLTQSDRTSWNNAVGDFMFTDIFATVRKPSGFNLFMSLGMNRRMCGLAVLSRPPLPSYVPPVVPRNLYVYASASSFIIQVNRLLSANQRLLIYSTRGYSRGISKFYGSYGFVTALSTYPTTNVSVGVQYVARFSDFPLYLQKISVKLVVVNSVTGLASLPQFISSIVQP